MFDAPAIGLSIVAGADLDEPLRSALRPGELVEDRHGMAHRLPSYFYRIPSWEAALEVKLAPNFGLWELIDVDVRETPAMRTFPRYVPCAITLLAGQLQILRSEIGRVVRIAANGGYRSPGHRLSHVASPHLWGTAANIYRIGDEWLDSRERIERYAQTARSILPGVWTRRWGRGPGCVLDHLHIDLGYVTLEPHDNGRSADQREKSPEEE
ncbi:MAG: hypothetical protein WD766_06385 [Gemmatimonadota bacterium]